MSMTPSDRELLLQTFFTEAGEHLQTIEAGLVALEDRPEDLEGVHEIFRLAHSLKGDAALVGFPRIAELAHALEDVLERLRDASLPVTADRVTALLHAVDVRRAMVRGAAAGDDTPPDTLAAALAALTVAAQDDAVPGATTAPALQRNGQTPEGEARTLRIDVTKLDRM